MRILALLLTFMLVPQFAFAAHTEAFKAAINEYSYNMTVEWDQKDKAFAANASKEFRSTLSSLMEKGLTKQEIKAVLVSMNPQLNLEQQNLELSLLNLSSPEALNKYLNSKLNSSYDQGASWNGRASSILVPLAVVAIIVGLVLIMSNNSNAGSTGEEEVCYDYYGQCYWECPPGYEDVDWFQDPCYQVCPVYCQ